MRTKLRHVPERASGKFLPRPAKHFASGQIKLPLLDGVQIGLAESLDERDLHQATVTAAPLRRRLRNGA
jgi:hypothetical protein